METKTLLLLGGAGIAAFVAYEYFSNSTPVTAPVTGGGSIAPTGTVGTVVPVVPVVTVNPVTGVTVVSTGPNTDATGQSLVINSEGGPAKTVVVATDSAPKVNGRWAQDIWNKYFNMFDPVTLSTSMIKNSTGMSLSDSNDFIGDLIANTSGASDRLTYNFGKIVHGNLLGLNPGKTAIMFNGTFQNPNDTGLSGLSLSDVQGWLTGSMFAGIPNWILVIGGVVVLKGIIK